MILKKIIVVLVPLVVGYMLFMASHEAALGANPGLYISTYSDLLKLLFLCGNLAPFVFLFTQIFDD